MKKLKGIINEAYKKRTVVPAFNVYFLPAIKPIIEAVKDEDSFALVQTCKLEWSKFDAKGYREVYEGYKEYESAGRVGLHLDHIPVIDEDEVRVDYKTIINGAVDLGYDSVMVDASRLPLDENIDATKKAADIAHKAGVPIEAELGKVMGHEKQQVMPYEEMFAKRVGFTDIDEAKTFVKQSNCDWLSVAAGNIHGAVSGILKDQEKPKARLDIDHIAGLNEALGIPLVLHGGSGINRDDILAAVKNGIAKINVGTEVRKAYEEGLNKNGSIEEAQEALYKKVRWLIRDYYNISGNRTKLGI